ncbi:hypothetical protein [Streptomyces sp. NPDC055105]|uniref:hypothetical protein n=1 Tax=Streptomyces sp. NPDC055105 TaxID=3365719 RepID=UPI0037D171C5
MSFQWAKQGEVSPKPPYSDVLITWNVTADGATYVVMQVAERYSVFSLDGAPLGISHSPGEVETVITTAEVNAKAKAEAVEAMTTHIRQRPARKWGDGFYQPQYSASENGSRTLCGAQPTDRDAGWGDARFAKNLAFVTCDECKQLRKA